MIKMSKQYIVIGSRGSELAMWQANHVADLLKTKYPELQIAIEIIHTTGDKILDTSLSILGGKGVFTKEIETALLDRQIDLAVHSLKDLPTTLPEGLMLGAIPERAKVEDVFLSKESNARLLDLPDGARIATGSIRRKAQLLTKRPDFQIVDIRGNVPTRIRKLLESNWDGMILASAGLERLGLTEHVIHSISLEWVLPAVGQGALGIECRSDDTQMLELLAALEHPPTRASVTAERALLAALGGGCQVPIGAHGKIVGGTLELSGCVAALNGESIVRAVHTGRIEEAETIGRELAKTLLDMGGKEMLEPLFDPSGDNPHPEV
jgi:hydroxymethylbilane synthase